MPFHLRGSLTPELRAPVLACLSQAVRTALKFPYRRSACELLLAGLQWLLLITLPADAVPAAECAVCC
jgi:hypothetical protein